MATTQEEIWEVLQKSMSRDTWVDIQDIYKLVQKSITLQPDDFYPEAQSAKGFRWKRNVRDVLQSKIGKEVIWSDDKKYMLRSGELKYYQDYNCEQVASIFAPDFTFQPEWGTEGRWGIIPIPSREADFVFFVTFDGQTGDGEAAVTEDGVLTWHSQSRQALGEEQINQFVQHDELINSVYLFLRIDKSKPYTYLGRLKYLSHDPTGETPLWFQWQILDWQPEKVASRMGLVLLPTTRLITPPLSSSINTLTETPAPFKKAVSTRKFSTSKAADHATIDAHNRTIDLAGELLVIEHERKSLISCGRSDLADKLHHVSKFEGEFAGYDIKSFTPDGDFKYIEVKTTTGSDKSSFFMSSNEIEFAKRYAANYYLYRVYAFDITLNSGQLFILHGDLTELLTFSPTQYRVSPA